jgi:hypothetical protein
LHLPLADSSGNSFQKANDGPPTYPMLVHDMPRKLYEDLQKRAEELRKKPQAGRSERAGCQKGLKRAHGALSLVRSVARKGKGGPMLR